MEGTSLDGLFIKLGVDMSPVAREMIRAEGVVSGSAGKIKDRLLGIATSLGTLRKEAGQVKEALASAADFRVRGDAALDKLHESLDKVRASGAATDTTLDKLSLSFEEASRGGKTYTQALDRIAADKGASNAVRDLARSLSAEAKEANLAAAALEKRQAALNRQMSQQRRVLTSTLRQAQKEENVHQVPQQAAASAAARLLEGQASIRAGERFLTGTLGLGSTLQGIFPVIGGLAFVGMLDELYDRAQRAYEALKKIQEQPQRIADEFRQLNGATALTNDELRVTNDRLANEIAKLEGKPENTLKLALDEARVAADKLAESLRKDLDEINKLLAEQNVSVFGRLLGNAGTTDIKKEFGGDTGIGGFYERVNDISYTGNENIRAAKTQPEKDAAQAELNSQLRAAYKKQLATVNSQLGDAEKLQRERDTPRPAMPVTPFGITPGAPEIQQAPGGPDQSARIQLLKGARTALSNQLDYLDLNQQNLDLTGKKDHLQGEGAADSLTRPYQDKMHELATQLEGVQGNLAAIGRTETGEKLAKSFADARQEITRLNDQLAKHHQSLTLDQQVDLVTVEDQIALTKSEEEWKKRLDQSTTSIENKVATLRLLAEAIGKSASVQRGTTIETRLTEALGPKAQDPEWMRTHQGDVQTLRRSITTEYDTEQSHQSAQNVAKLSEEIQLERSLATVQSQGAEAIRAVTLAYRLRNLTMQGATPAQIKAEVDLADAQKRNRNAADLAQGSQELKATQRLSAAQLQGAEPYRKTQLALKYEQMNREGKSPEVIQQERTLDEAKHQAEITSEALKTGLTYQNQLDSLDQQLAALEQLKAAQGDSLAIEQSLKTLEQERARVFAQQVSIVGTARDGLKAYFEEMATQGVSSAEQVHDALKSTFDSLNDALAKMASGQKVSWASLFSGISEQLAKISIRNLEAKFASVLTANQNGQQPASRLGKITQTIGGIFAPPKPAAPGQTPPAFERAGLTGRTGQLRDGQSSSTALFVTMVSQQGQPSPFSGTSSPSAPAGLPPLPIPIPVKRSSLTTPEVPGSAAANAGYDLTRLASGLILRQPKKSPLEFGGFRADGGSVDAGKLHVVGEEGPELFIPDEDGTIVPADETKSLTERRKRKGSDRLLLAGNRQAEANALANALEAKPSNPHAFDNTKSSSKLLNISLPTEAAGNQWLAVVHGATFALNTASKMMSGGGGGGSSSGSGESFGGSASSDPNAGYNLTRLDSGLILRQPADSSTGGAGLTSEDMNNLGGSDNISGDLASLDNSSVTPPMPSGAFPSGGDSSGKSLTGPLIMMGASMALGIANMLMSRPKDHHFKPGNAYAIPNFNGAFADGGTAKSGMAHLVGERGPELFIPHRRGTIIPNHKLRFGGFRAMGGSVDPGNAYITGEAGTEAFAYSTPAVSSTSSASTAGGAGVVNNYYDARGTDPAAVEQRIRQANVLTHKASVRTSFQAYQEHKLRTPEMK